MFRTIVLRGARQGEAVGFRWATSDLDAGYLGVGRPIRIFKQYAAEAGVRVIKLHESRHSAASLARDAGVDPKIRKEQLGHTTQAMSDHYTHVLAEAHLEAAERVARLVAGETKEAGS